jgi:hypothetical protein
MKSFRGLFSFLADFEKDLDRFQSKYYHDASLSLRVLLDTIYHDIAKFHVYIDAIATRSSFDALQE